MPYTFEAGKMYRMPTHFGPRTGPRQGPDGRRFANVDTPRNTTVAVSFLTVLWEDLADPILTGREELGTADVAYPVFTPATGSNERILERRSGRGSVQFHPTSWEEMPTQYSIVNAFADLAIVEYCGATVTRSVGAKDLRDQRSWNAGIGRQ